MKRIEARENDFIVHFKEMLKESFPPALGFEVEYYIGEDKQGTRGLYFAITSKDFGHMYSRFGEIQSHQTTYDVEEGFTNKVINDLVLAGVTFLNLEAYREHGNLSISKEIQETPFRATLPRKMLFVN